MNSITSIRIRRNCFLQQAIRFKRTLPLLQIFALLFGINCSESDQSPDTFPCILLYNKQKVYIIYYRYVKILYIIY